jgi:hypothetical protein
MCHNHSTAACTGRLDEIRKEAWLFCRTSSSVRLYWELEEPKGPQGLVKMRTLSERTWCMGIGAHRLSPCTLSLNVTCKNGQPLYKNVVRGQGSARHSSQFKNNHCTETCSGSRFSPCTLSLNVTCTYGGVISKLVISYISWELITPVIRLITFRADDISARALGCTGCELCL